MRLLRRLARLAMITTMLGSTAALVAAASPAASAAGPDGWIRIAHLSPEAPAMDMYLYPFGSPRAEGMSAPAPSPPTRRSARASTRWRCGASARRPPASRR